MQENKRKEVMGGENEKNHSFSLIWDGTENKGEEKTTSGPHLKCFLRSFGEQT